MRARTVRASSAERPHYCHSNRKARLSWLLRYGSWLAPYAKGLGAVAGRPDSVWFTCACGDATRTGSRGQHVRTGASWENVLGCWHRGSGHLWDASQRTLVQAGRRARDGTGFRLVGGLDD